VKIKTALCLAPVLSAALVSQALAQADVPQPLSPWYFGFGLSRSDATIKRSSLDTISGGETPDIDDRFNGFQAYVGYQYSRFLAIEVGGGRIGTSRIGFSPSGNSMEYRMSTFFADVVGIWPGGEKWALIARVGATIGETRIGVSNLVLTSDQRDETDANVKFGVGGQYYFTPDVGARLEYLRYKMPDPVSNDNVKIDNMTGSIFFRF
jgi:OOP family OmpA-OmpF porin